MEQTIRIGTRKSALALRQTELAENALRTAYPFLQMERVPLQTKGDKVLDKPLWEIGRNGEGLFASELEKMLLRDEIDIAVHSGKDLPQFLPEGLAILAALKRDDPRDVLVMPAGRRAEDCRIIGTGSLRRQAFLARLFPQAETRLVRGNVQTRLQKMTDGAYDGIILAKAGLDRLGITERDGYAFRVFSPEECLPAACQGIIVVEGKPELAELFQKISHRETMLEFETERCVLERTDAGCSQPAAAFAEYREDTIRLRAMFGNKRAEGTAPAGERLSLAAEIAGRLK